MHRQRLVLLLVLPLLLASLSLFSVSVQPIEPTPSFSVFHIQEAQALAAINAAQTAINTAYTNLAFADITGADITDLIGTLNTAINELDQARRAYNNTNYASAITLAENAQNTADSISEEAQIRRYTALIQLQVQAIIIIAFVVIAIIIGYFVVTRWQKYHKEKRREFMQMEIQLPNEEDEGETT